MKKIIIITIIIILLVIIGIFINIKFFPKTIHEQELIAPTSKKPLKELLICDCCCDDDVSQIICIDSANETLEDIDRRYKENPPACNPNVKCQLRKLFKYCKTR